MSLPRASCCELCEQQGGQLLWTSDFARVVLVNDADYPGFCRVILQQHVAEMSDLPVADAQRLLVLVLTVERVLRAVLQPDKINLASLGNMVNHLHWHIIPRFRDDAHFPQPIWGQRQREPASRSWDAAYLADAIHTALILEGGR